MMRTRRIVLALTASAVLASGCSSADVAATVNGSEITDAYVLSLRPRDVTKSSVSSEEFRSDLSRLIFTEAMLAAAETEFGLTGLDTPQAREAFEEQAPLSGRNLIDSMKADPAFTESAIDVLITQLLLRSEVRKALALRDDVLQKIWQDDQPFLLQICVSHILVATQVEAEEVLGRLNAGEDLAVLADAVSLDTTSPGGALPCPISPSSFVGPFAAAISTVPVGEFTGPIETQFGWHVIFVESRDVPESLEELAADPLKWIPDTLLDGPWGRWLNDAVESADIKVRSQIGTWYPPVDGILPPPPSP